MALWPTVHSLILAMPETKTPTSCPRHDFLIVVTKPLVIVTPAASICSSASADYVVSGTRSIVEQRGYHLSQKPFPAYLQPHIEPTYTKWPVRRREPLFQNLMRTSQLSVFTEYVNRDKLSVQGQNVRNYS